jgi:uncharacterized protein YndB with AHSA1/START domain
MATTEQTFDVSVSDLFATLANPDTYPHWLVGAKRIRSVSDDWPQPKSFFEHVVGFGPAVIPDRTTVRAIDPPHMLEMLVRARPLLEAVVRFEVRGSATGCTLVMRETPAGVYKAISSVAQPLIRARNERSLRRLQEYVESRGAVPTDAEAGTEGFWSGVRHLTGEQQARDNAADESPT